MNLSEHSVGDKLRSLRSPNRKNRNHALMLIAEVLLGAAIVLGVTGISTGIGMFRGIIAETPPFQAEEVVPTGYFSTVYNAKGEVTDRLIGTDANRIEASYDELPRNLINAFVAIEDSRFWQHNGIDVRSIFRAAVGILTDNYSGGASTITQQLIKNTVFNGGMETSTGARFERKIEEQYLALELTRDMSREDILTNYLNTINLGSDTLGVKAAALRYFGKSVSDLTLSECAVIAGITQNPSKYNPITNPENNRERRSTILAEMYRQGYISAGERDEALADDVYSRIQNVNTSIDDRRPYSYYTDELIDQVADALKEKYSCTDTQAYNMIYSGGLQIYTPQDPDIQAIVDEEVNNPDNYDAAKISVEYHLSVENSSGDTADYSEKDLENWLKQNGQPDFDGVFDSADAASAAIESFKKAMVPAGAQITGETRTDTLEPQVSFVLMDQKNGNVLALSGGRGQKTASRTLNRASDVTRQPGSTFKVISTFAPALDTCGATLATVYYDAPFSQNGKQFSNWWGDSYKGYHTIREGITYSMNIIALRCMDETVTPQLGVEYARRMGISTLTSDDYNLATALGGITRGVTNLELTDAFAAIANGGEYNKPIFFTKITDKDGNVLIETKNESRQVLKDSTAFLLTDAMADSMKANTLYETYPGIHSTGTAAAIPGMSCAGKSGTTSDNRDVWFVGFTPYYTAGIWGGLDGNQSLKGSGAENGGTSFHKRIWRNIMQRVHSGLADPGFTVPDDVTTTEVCRKSGKLPVDGVCDYDPRGTAVYTEYFAKGTEPTEACDHHVSLTVCGYSYQRPAPECPRDHLFVDTFMKLPEGEGDTDDSYYAIPGYCTVHGDGQTGMEGLPTYGMGGSNDAWYDWYHKYESGDNVPPPGG